LSDGGRNVNNLLEAKGISKAYGRDSLQVVLEAIDLDIAPGEFVSIMGPSGSGKSTLLHMLSGMDRPTAGKVALEGQDLSVLSEDKLAAIRLTRMGFIFQQTHLLKNLCVLDNILLPAYHAKRGDRVALRKRARDLMTATGIDQLTGRDISEVSGGQLQRAGICRALMNEPSIVFADEPTGALNSKAAAEIMDILRRINDEGTTILLVTHDPKVAARTERVLYMRDGRIVADEHLGKYAPPADLVQRETKLSNTLVRLDA
jgi:putative ABC transport system ATP-binding protein